MVIDNRESVRGDLLSCYTTSIAEYMERSGINHQLALGTQLFLAVSSHEEDAAQLSFVHYHTPLLGRHPTYSIHLMRKSSLDPHEAEKNIYKQYKQFGSVLVAGDAWNLPWLVTCGRKHVPHWFVVTAIDEQKQHIQITDRFEFVDEHGTQTPFEGQVECSQLSKLAAANPIQNRIYQARNRWAFGADDQESGDTFCGNEWFEAVKMPESSSVSRQDIWELLSATWAFHTNQKKRNDLPAPQWVCGVDALRYLACCFEEQANNPVLYEHSDDMWVAARNRQMFVLVLKMVSSRYRVEELNTLAFWCEEELLPLWDAVPRIMRYNMGCLQRGRRPRSLLVESLSKLALLEEDLM